MSEVAFPAKFCNPSQGKRYNKVWVQFLDTFYVNRNFDGVFYDVQTALAYSLAPLKRLAESEDWGPNDLILVNYFVHTFYELCKAQEKEPNGRYIVEYDRWIYFNTGLITGNMERIYAAFEENYGARSKGTKNKPQYFLSQSPKNFMRDVHMITYCYPLPDRCRYFDDFTQLIMDGTKKPTVSWAHIIDENWARICKVLYPEADDTNSEFKRQKQYDAQNRLQGALESALIRVLTNYRTAVPQSFKGELQLLLPLCILQPSKADLVLTISRVNSKPPIPGMFTYTARTILTLSMAYQNARLVARPEKDWLVAANVVTESDDEVYDED